MTGTETGLFGGLAQAASWFHVDDGTVVASAASRPSA
jgi:hypothetical protein